MDAKPDRFRAAPDRKVIEEFELALVNFAGFREFMQSLNSGYTAPQGLSWEKLPLEVANVIPELNIDEQNRVLGLFKQRLQDIGPAEEFRTAAGSRLRGVLNLLGEE